MFNCRINKDARPPSFSSPRPPTRRPATLPPGKRQRQRRGEEGHTIIEVVIALLLIAILVPATVNLLGSIVKRTHISYWETKEVLSAASRLEEIKSGGFAAIVGGDGNHTTSEGCTVAWRIDKGENEAKVFVSANCSLHQRGIVLKTIIVP